MPEIIRTFREKVPKMRFICKKYPDFGPWWGEWFAGGWFDIIENAMGGPDKIRALWENGGAYVGLERHAEGRPFEYRIGMFAPAGSEVPKGFEYKDFPAGHLGTCWIYGKEDEVHDTSGFFPALEKAGIRPQKDEEGVIWTFENCLCPRFTTPDEKGNVILDYCCYAE